MLTILNRQQRLALSIKETRAQLDQLLSLLGYSGWDVGLLFTGNRKIRMLNRMYRGKDQPTDILSFPFYEVTTPGQVPSPATHDERNLGDIVISAQYVQGYCQRHQIPVHKHLPLLYTHGLCHLLGYDHETKQQHRQMAQLEQSVLRQFWSWHKHRKMS
ncbi:hypothetical protein H4R34_000836 [Dimargaris verticillata]|uniref:Uncharacterized protein n=1 Tax=Dimargaris verticillata TaxID=2761393 RepID=A0A9W8EAX1_9FUNG|nr:hypothetical protein H4R34_000836 [Dimargaris verticillata]